MKITVVSDEYGACPRCGAYWGNPNKNLDFPNRQKVDNHWKCYNPNCTAAYYDPETKVVVEDKLPPDEMKALSERVKAEVKEMLKGKHWEETRPNVWELVPD